MATPSRRTGPSPAYILGSSPALQDALARAARVAPHRAVPVLLSGESGTGKELFARFLHERSGKPAAPFITVNCAAIPRDLLESELFGHERGAFTGAATIRSGAFERAHGGTLFLDEIGDMAMEHQAKLLRAVQEGEVQRIGGSVVRRVDVRLITATHRDLYQRAAEGHFREDLFFRLAGYELQLPPLRARGRDVLAIAEALLARDFSGKTLAATARTLLLRHPWPGNVRELQQVVRAAAIDAEGDEISAAGVRRHLRHRLPRRRGAATTSAAAVVEQLLRYEEQLTSTALQYALGISKTQRGRVLARLEAEGAIARRGRGRGTYYVAGSDKPDARRRQKQR